MRYLMKEGLFKTWPPLVTTDTDAVLGGIPQTDRILPVGPFGDGVDGHRHRLAKERER